MFTRHKARVRRSGGAFGLALCALTLCAAPLPTRAQKTGMTGTAGASSVPSAAPAPSEGGLLAQMSRELSALVQQSRDGVVSIQGHRALSAQELADGGASGRFAAFPPPPPDLPFYVPVIGSGFLVQGDLVVTTSEVAENIVNPVVMLADGRSLRVVAKSLDKDTNLAVFRVARMQGADTLHILRLGDSEYVLPGSIAITIGNQAGFAGSSGFAMIAKVGRRARSGARFYPNLIQFQGAVGPGSSGSPLIGPAGDVIGMVIATPDVSPTGYRGGGDARRMGGEPDWQKRRQAEAEHADKVAHSSILKQHKSQKAGEPVENQAAGRPTDQENGGRGRFTPPPMSRFAGPGGGPFSGLSSMGFALPVNVFRDRLDALARNMQAVAAPGWMGLHAENGPLPGAYVTNLYDGSPADRGGLDVGDIITRVEGHLIRSQWEFNMFLKPAIEGQTLRVQVQRGGVTREMLIRLNAMPDQDTQRRMSQRVPSHVGMRLLLLPPVA